MVNKCIILFMYCEDSRIFIENDDLCNTCENYIKELDCPLLGALIQGDVFLEDNLLVTRCGFYKEFKRNLYIVKGKKKDENSNFN